MQLFPHAFPAVQTLQHSPLGSTDHSMLPSPFELAGGFAIASPDPALLMLSTNNAAVTTVRKAMGIRPRYAAAGVG